MQQVGVRHYLMDAHNPYPDPHQIFTSLIHARDPQALATVVEALEAAVGRASVPPWPSAVTSVSKMAEVSHQVLEVVKSSWKLGPTVDMGYADLLMIHTFKQAVQFRRFRQAVRLMHCIGCFEGLLSRSLLIRLSIASLAVAQCLPYLRGALAVTGGNGYQLAVSRLEAVAAAIPSEWLQGDEIMKWGGG